VVRQQRDEAPIAERLGREERRKLGDGVSRDRSISRSPTRQEMARRAALE